MNPARGKQALESHISCLRENLLAIKVSKDKNRWLHTKSNGRITGWLKDNTSITRRLIPYTNSAMGAYKGPKGLGRLISFACVLGYALATPFEYSECYGGEGTFFQFSTGTLDGQVMSFDEHKGKVVIALNVASF